MLQRKIDVQKIGSFVPPPLKIGDITVPMPVIQGGMGVGISLSGLAAAVGRAGGVGVIATAGIGYDEPDFRKDHKGANSRALKRHIRLARAAGARVLGVNIMVAMTNFDELVSTAVQEGADLIFSGAGLPLSLPKVAGVHSQVKLVPIVSSARAAELLCRKWGTRYGRLPDAFVVEGPMAGGHLGFKAEQVDQPEFALEKILKEVVHSVRAYGGIPVIAAGGVYTGADIHAMMELGAAGCQMGTRFVGTEECDAALEFKKCYLDARAEDIRLIKSPVGLPGRAIVTSLVRDMEEGRRRPLSCPYHCLRGCVHSDAPFCISKALIEAKQGNLLDGLVFAGSNAWRVDRIVPVAELMQELRSEYAEACVNLLASGRAVMPVHCAE